MTKNSDTNRFKELSPNDQASGADVDFSMLEDSLQMTPWERILVNDDIINFGDSLRDAMEKRNAKSR